MDGVKMLFEYWVNVECALLLTDIYDLVTGIGGDTDKGDGEVSENTQRSFLYN